MRLTLGTVGFRVHYVVTRCIISRARLCFSLGKTGACHISFCSATRWFISNGSLLFSNQEGGIVTQLKISIRELNLWRTQVTRGRNVLKWGFRCLGGTEEEKSITHTCVLTRLGSKHKLTHRHTQAHRLRSSVLLCKYISSVILYLTPLREDLKKNVQGKCDGEWEGKKTDQRWTERICEV